MKTTSDYVVQVVVTTLLLYAIGCWKQDLMFCMAMGYVVGELREIKKTL